MSHGPTSGVFAKSLLQLLGLSRGSIEMLCLWVFLVEDFFSAVLLTSTILVSFESCSSRGLVPMLDDDRLMLLPRRLGDEKWAYPTL
jgi:hypothetical protein